MRPFCRDCSIETIRSKANKVFLVANVMFKGSFTLIVFTVRLATSSFAIPVLRYANSKNVPAAPCINNY